jgi:acyl-CoA dehydrogenase
MDFLLPEGTRELQRAVREFVQAEVEPLAQAIEEMDEIPASLVQRCGEMGLFGLSIPTDYGGLGLGMIGRCAVFEELGKTHNGFTTLIGAHASIGTVGIVELGTEEQRGRFLPDLAAGVRIGAFSITEPDAGSDASNLKTRAVRRADVYVVNGRKHFCTNAPIADIFTVMTSTAPGLGPNGITAFLIERGTPGFTIGRSEPAMGLRGSHTAELVFEDCEVPVQNILGRENDGYASALRILSRGRVSLAARNLGSCQKLLDLSVQFAQERVQFGVPIIEHQAVAHMIADMAMEIEALRSLVYRVAWMVEQGTPVTKESSIAKLYGSEVYGRVADRAVQIHGSMGYMKSYPIERFYRDARVARIYEGTSEIQRNIIAAQVRKGSAVGTA